MQPVSSRRDPALALRRDPAPTRLAYRLNRLWLTPLFRALLRVGLPAFVIVFGVGVYFADTERQAAASGWIGDLQSTLEQRPEFMVTQLQIAGAADEVSNALRALVPVQLPASSFDLDLAALQVRLETFDAVESADLQITAGGVLLVTIRQRTPALIWRGRGGLDLLDATGHRVAGVASRAARPDLPLIAGDGADQAVPEALALIAAAGPLGQRLRGLVRMGQRRWDLVLDQDQRLLLPEQDPVPALERVIALDQAQELLSRAVSQVDMRIAHRPTVRVIPPAPLSDPEALTEAKATTP